MILTILGLLAIVQVHSKKAMDNGFKILRKC